MRDAQDVTVDKTPLSDQYHKARRMLVLFSALLFAKTWLGVEFGDKSSQYADAEVLKTVIGEVTIGAPESLPWVFVAAVLYFAARLGLEWNQSMSETIERRKRAATQDLYLTLVIAGSSILLLALQIVLGIRIATILSSYWVSLGGIFTGAMVLGYILAVVWSRIKSGGTIPSLLAAIPATTAAVLVPLLLFLYVGWTSSQNVWAVVVYCGGLLVGSIYWAGTP